MATYETSKDGTLYTGASYQAGKGSPTRDTFTNASHTSIDDVTQVQMGSKWTTVAHAVCTKG